MNPRRISIALVLLALIAARIPGAQAPAGPVQKRLAGMPRELAGWVGTDDPFDSNVMKVVATDDDLHRIYRKGNDFVWLYIGYYGTNKGGRTGHLPHHCYPAAGYRIVSMNTVPVPGADGKTVRVNHLILERNGQTTSTLYWIHSGEQQVLVDGWAMNLTRIRRRLMKGRDDGALVRISGPVQGSIEDTLRRQIEFAGRIFPSIKDNWPLEIPG